MWLIVFLLLWPQGAAPEVDPAFFAAKVQPLFLEKRPGHARCITCHATSTAFRLQPLPPGARDWTAEQAQKNFEMARTFVVPGQPQRSRLLTMPLSHEAGGTAFHPGGKHWESQDDPEWKTLADWVNGAR